MTIREMRESLGLTQAEFAERYGIPKRSVENWEYGKRTPPDYVVSLLQRCVEMDRQQG